jgi:hypothetical protein
VPGAVVDDAAQRVRLHEAKAILIRGAAVVIALHNLNLRELQREDDERYENPNAQNPKIAARFRFRFGDGFGKRVFVLWVVHGKNYTLV